MVLCTIFMASYKKALKMKYLYTILSFLLCLQMNAALVSFSVDMNNYTGVINTVEINGTFNNFCGTCNPMAETSPGSGVYEVTIDLPAENIEYKFTVNATTPNEYYETLLEGAPCTVSAFGFTNRFLAIGADDITLETACFEACAACDDVLPNYEVTFRVDLSEYTGASFNSVDLNGSFNGFCGGCAPMTDIGNNVYELAVTLEQGTYEYLFTLDEFNTGQESFEDGDPCTSTIDGFVNRTIDVDSDETLGTVCWESCVSCGASGIEEFTSLDMVVQPNPSSGNIQITLAPEFQNEMGQVNIFTLTGEQLSSQAISSIRDGQLDLNWLSQGIYLIEVRSDEFRSLERLMIQK